MNRIDERALKIEHTSYSQELLNEDGYVAVPVAVAVAAAAADVAVAIAVGVAVLVAPNLGIMMEITSNMYLYNLF